MQKITTYTFVGLHHKPGKPALCSSTKTGKVIDHIIAQCQHTGYEFEKTNLFPTDHLPDPEERKRYASQFKAQPGTLYIGLGKVVERYLSRELCPSVFFPFAHPGSMRYMKSQARKEYLESIVELICSYEQERDIFFDEEAVAKHYAAHKERIDQSRRKFRKLGNFYRYHQ